MARGKFQANPCSEIPLQSKVVTWDDLRPSGARLQGSEPGYVVMDEFTKLHQQNWNNPLDDHWPGVWQAMNSDTSRRRREREAEQKRKLQEVEGYGSW